MSTTPADKMAKNRELILQLLAKAESTEYPAEAEAFQEHAERLMVRYGIDMAQLDAEAGKRGEMREAMVERRYTLRGTYRRVESLGLTAVARAFKSVVVLEQAGKNTLSLYLIGAESDVEQITRLFDSLRAQVKHALSVWWLQQQRMHWLTTAEKGRERRQFHLGFYAGATGRVEAVYGAEVAAAEAGTELVLVAREGRAKEYTRELYPELKTSLPSRLAHGSADAQRAGKRAGLAADVLPGRNVAAAGRAAVAS